MKIIMPEHSVEDIKIGDKFLNTSWTVDGQWWKEKDSSGRWRTYVPVKCNCGTQQRGRWDRLHTTKEDKAPWSTRCRKCSAGGIPRKMDCMWHNCTKGPNEKPQNKINDLSGQTINGFYIIQRMGTDQRSHSLYQCKDSNGKIMVLADDKIKGYEW